MVLSIMYRKHEEEGEVKGNVQVEGHTASDYENARGQREGAHGGRYRLYWFKM